VAVEQVDEGAWVDIIRCEDNFDQPNDTSATGWKRKVRSVNGTTKGHF